MANDAKMKVMICVSDEDERESFTGYLTDNGYDVVHANDGAKAMELAVKETPNLIILDLELPVVEGERVFKILLNNPHTAKVPFVFLSNTASDVDGFRPNKDIFLRRPFNEKELYARIKQTLQSVQISGAEGDTKEIEGKISHMPLPDLFQILQMNKKEGLLKITNNELDGTVYIKKGEIYNATIGEIEKEKALFRMLGWKDGSFSFTPKPINVPQRITQNSGNLMMEAMRQADEFEKDKKKFPEVTSTLKAKVDTANLPKGLRPIIYEVIFHLDFYPNVQDLVDHSSFTDFDVYTTIVNLIKKGILEEIKGTGESETKVKEIISADQAIKIKEKVVSRWSDMLSVNFGKIFVAATSPTLINEFVMSCAHLPKFTAQKKKLVATETTEAGEKEDIIMGEVASLKLHGGIEMIFFSIPTDKTMIPLWQAFSSNLIGLMLLWDEQGGYDLDDLIRIKSQILSTRRVPTVHAFLADYTPDNKLLTSFKKNFNMKPDEEIFTCSQNDKDVSYELFQYFFDALVKDDYISGGSVIG